MESTIKLLQTYLPENLKEKATYATDRGYRNLQSSYMKKGNPAVIIEAEFEQDVQQIIENVRKINQKTHEQLPLSVRSGGHGMSGSSTNDLGVVIDLRRMNQVEVIDEINHLVRVQAGADWGKVATALGPYDLVLTSGNFGDVGVGGLAPSGGIGYFVRSVGLTLDLIQSATLVTATGEILLITAEEHPDLFWAVRGGGSQLGVITEFVFKAHKIGSTSGNAAIVYQSVTYVTKDIASFVEDWGSLMREAPRKWTSFLMLQKNPDGAFYISATNVWDGSNVDDVKEYLERALSLSPVYDHQEGIVPYPNIIPYPHSIHTGQQRIQIRNVLVNKVDKELGRAIDAAFQHSVPIAMELRFVGGAMNDIGVSDTAWAARTQEGFVDLWMVPSSHEEQTLAFSALRKLGTGAYGAYSSDTSDDVLNLAWPGETGARLGAIVRKLDPENLFNQGIRFK